MMIVVLIVMIVLTFFVSSCGTTKAVVRQPKDTAVTTISITTNNPVQVETTPDVDLSVTPNTN